MTVTWDTAMIIGAFNSASRLRLHYGGDVHRMIVSFIVEKGDEQVVGRMEQC